jgi:hypothetical protein
MNPQDQKIFRVAIIRTDLRDPIYVLDTDKWSEAIQAHIKLEELWIETIKNHIPFKLTTPIYRTFSPSLIKEILIESMTPQEYQSMISPYAQGMRDLGPTEFMNRNFTRGSQY